VFSKHDWHLPLLNIFHRTTLRDIVKRELLLSPGQCCDEQVCPVAVAGASTPLAYRRRTLALDGNVVRSLGHADGPTRLDGDA
jgi:hypothetical protein